MGIDPPVIPTEGRQPESRDPGVTSSVRLRGSWVPGYSLARISG